MAELIARPECYYLNIHTTEFPDGAIRGQLVEGTCEPPATTTAVEVTHTRPAVSTTGAVGGTTTAPRFTG